VVFMQQLRRRSEALSFFLAEILDVSQIQTSASFVRRSYTNVLLSFEPSLSRLAIGDMPATGFFQPQE
jgi:hypothetical protein